MRTAESATLDVSLDLEAIETVLREYPVRLAILFGSHATDTTHETSNIDLAVEFDDHRPSDSNYNGVSLGLGVNLVERLHLPSLSLGGNAVALRPVSNFK